MVSSPLPSWMLGSELPQPEDEAGLRRTFDGYRAVLRAMSPEQLVTQANLIAGMLQTQSNEALILALSRPSSGSTPDLDLPVQRTTPSRSTPAPSPRGRAAQGSPASPPPSPLDLLFGSRGRRLANKLVAANARSINGRRMK
jgi:hypothetical protein